jgi:tungstate transport system ATP-binding protein
VVAFLEVRNVSFSRGGARILRDVSLEAERGQVLVIIGPTGSGKTTLLRLIDLLESPNSGSIFLQGKDLARASDKERQEARKRMAMVFQKPVMFRSTVAENVSYGLKIRGIRRKERVKEALHAVGLPGYEARIATTLSGGEMQRTALARAMVIEPEVLLLDEPTANLDPKTAATIDDLIASFSRQGAGVIMATHNMQQAEKLGTRVAVLVEGRIVAEGSPDQIFARKKIAANLPW